MLGCLHNSASLDYICELAIVGSVESIIFQKRGFIFVEILGLVLARDLICVEIFAAITNL